MKIARRRTLNAEIPTASMADISFLLIIFFLVTRVFSATRGLDFDLPAEETAAKAEEVEAVYIQIAADGSLRVDKQPVELARLLEVLEPEMKPGAGDPDRQVIIRPDPQTPFQALIDVYDELRQARERRGFEIGSVSIPTQRQVREYVEKYGVNPFDIQ
jgi:biopolymer transport protein ExbD